MDLIDRTAQGEGGGGEDRWRGTMKRVGRDGWKEDQA